MKGILTWLKHEIVELAPAWLFFFFFILLLKATEWAILKEVGINEKVLGATLIFTMIIAKVFIVLDKIKAINRLDKKPLFYNILWKTILYSIGITLARLVEKLLSHSVEDIRKALGFPRFWIVLAWTLVLTFIFSSVRELFKKMGKEKFLKLLFSAP
jgi:hypothetical protein